MADNQLPQPSIPKSKNPNLSNVPIGKPEEPGVVAPPPSTLMSAGQVHNIDTTLPLPTTASPVKEPMMGGMAPTPDQLTKMMPSTPAPLGGEVKVTKEAPQIIQPGGGGAKPKFAALNKGPLMKFLPFILGGAVILVIALVILSKLFAGGNKSASVSQDQPAAAGNTASTVPKTTKQVTLTYWGLWEGQDIIEPLLREFEQANPGVLVKYVKQSPKDYRERLQTAIASGQGPDLFRFHASWVPMLKDDLASLPASVMSVSDYRKNFYPIAEKQLQSNGQIVGVPLMFDSLMLYYNEEIFTTASLQPPKTWAELKEIATTLTIRENDKVKRAGIALGNASNVEHFADVLGLLMIQNGADFTKPSSKAAQDALTFYTNFVKVDKVWSNELPSSTVAFARGDAAMMFAPSWRAHDIKATNPNLKFKMVAVPRLANKDVVWATYWAEGVNSKGKSKDEAWKLIQFLSSSASMKKLYSNQSQTRAFGEPYSRVDLAASLSTDPNVSPVLAGAGNAQNWYLNSYTHDNGLNDQLIKYYQDAINAILTGNKQVKEVMDTVEKGTTQVLRQYSVPATN